MAPEQTRNLNLTTASDLYGLGLTLGCVIAQLTSHEIGEYVDWSNQLDPKAIEAKIKGCSFRCIEWLNQMVAPDAATALKAPTPLRQTHPGRKTELYLPLSWHWSTGVAWAKRSSLALPPIF